MVDGKQYAEINNDNKNEFIEKNDRKIETRKDAKHYDRKNKERYIVLL